MSEQETFVPSANSLVIGMSICPQSRRLNCLGVCVCVCVHACVLSTKRDEIIYQNILANRMAQIAMFKVTI